MSEELSDRTAFYEFAKNMELLYVFTEEEFLAFDRIVPMRLNKDNMNTVSTKLYFILLTTCGQIDSIAYQILKNIKCPNIKNQGFVKLYKKFQQDGEGVLPKMQAIVISTILGLNPFSEPEIPQWWISYNSTKHALPDGLTVANITNTINALAALRLLLNMYYISFENTKDILDKKRWGHNQLSVKHDHTFVTLPHHHTLLFDIPTIFRSRS